MSPSPKQQAEVGAPVAVGAVAPQAQHADLGAPKHPGTDHPAQQEPQQQDLQQQHLQQPGKETASGLHRQWQLLSRLSPGRWTGTRQLQEQLQREGIDVSLRTIQRDLNQLAQRFPIESNHEVPQGWRWQADAPVQSLPHMSSSQAVTFMMVEEHLRHLMPPSLLAEMRPWFDLARRSLSVERNNVRQWLNRVRIIPPNQPLIPPRVNRIAQQAIYEALLRDQKLRARYQARAKTSKEYLLNPLGLVQRGAIIYLICTRDDIPDSVRMFALHRFGSAEVLNQKAQRPADFDLDDYLNSGALGFGFQTGKDATDPQLVRLRFRRPAAHSVLECPLSQDQQLIEETEHHVTLSATVPLTAQLIWWLRGFGPSVQVLEPSVLAERVAGDDYPLPQDVPSSTAPADRQSVAADAAV